MANYSVNTNLPGAKKVTVSETALVVGSSSKVAAFVVSLDSNNMQQTIDGYITAEVNTDKSVVVIQHSAALAANQLVGNYVWVNFATPEVRLIVANTAAVAAADCTITVDRDFGTAVTATDSVNIRRWEDFKIPRVFTSLAEFAEVYIDKDASGNYEWALSENAFYTISEFKNHQGGVFIVIPVIEDTDADVMEGRLGTELTTDATFKARMLSLSPQPDLFCCPKQPKMSASLSAANWAAVDTAHAAYILSRATDDTADDSLRAMQLVVDTPVASTAAALTYRNTTWGSTYNKAVLDHGQYLVSSITRGKQQAVNCSPARCATINRISNVAPNSYGHAFKGKKYSQVVIMGLVERDLSPTDRILLISNGINPLITKPALGAWFESQVTQAHNAADVGADADEHLHVMIGSNTFIGPGLILRENVEENKFCYLKQSVIVRKNLQKIGLTDREEFRKKL